MVAAVEAVVIPITACPSLSPPPDDAGDDGNVGVLTPPEPSRAGRLAPHGGGGGRGSGKYGVLSSDPA